MSDEEGVQQYLQRCFTALNQLASNISVSPSTTTSSCVFSSSPLSGSSSTSVTSSAFLPASPVTTASLYSSASSSSQQQPPLYPRVWQEHRNVFRRPLQTTIHSVQHLHPYQRSRDRARVRRHIFLCLASRSSHQVPSPRVKMLLKAADQGEKQLTIGLRASAAQLHSKIMITFPRLVDGGGYELLRCLPNSRQLVQVDVPEGGHSPSSLQENVGQARLYVQPLQRDLSMDPQQHQMSPYTGEVRESGVLEKCLLCGEEVPLELLSHHLGSCRTDCLSTPVTSASRTSTIIIVSSPGALCVNTVASPCTTTTLGPLPSPATARRSQTSDATPASSLPGPSSGNNPVVVEEEEEAIAHLYEVVPGLTGEQAGYMMNLFGGNVQEVADCLTSDSGPIPGTEMPTSQVL